VLASVGSDGTLIASHTQANFDRLLDMKLPDLDGLEVLKKIKEFDTEILVIMMTAYSDIQSAVSSIKSGAYNYINKFSYVYFKWIIEIIYNRSFYVRNIHPNCTCITQSRRVFYG
jgi:DNA-binding NtrC family response regulator